jgi:hypothetical protein
MRERARDATTSAIRAIANPWNIVSNRITAAPTTYSVELRSHRREVLREEQLVPVARRRAHLAGEHPVHEHKIPDGDHGSERPPDKPN